MSGRRSWEKGSKGEREVCEILRPLFPAVRRRVCGEEGQLVNLGRDLRETPGFCVQVMRAQKPEPARKLNEAIAAVRADEIPVAFTRRSSREKSEGWIVSMRSEDFVRLLSLSRATLPVAVEASPLEAGGAAP